MRSSVRVAASPARRRGPAPRHARAPPGPWPAGTSAPRRSRPSRRRGAASRAIDRGVDVGTARHPIGRFDERRSPERAGELSGLVDEVVTAGVPQLVDPLAQLDEADHLAAALAREVGAGEEGTAVGRREHRHGPAALAGHRLSRLHVDVVDVGTLLAIDLDGDEAIVDHLADVRVLEGLVRHDVAPVAGRVADRHEHRHLAPPSLGKRLVAPRPPVDRVVGMLAQVGAGLVGEPVHPATLRARSLAANLA